MPVEILDVPKSDADIRSLLDEVNRSGFIGEVTRREIDDYLRDHTIRFFYQDGMLVGFGAWQKIDAEWRELGPFYASDKHRGKGIGKLIVDTLVQLNADSSLYAVTKNPAVKAMLERRGFQKVSVAALPASIRSFLARKIT